MPLKHSSNREWENVSLRVLDYVEAEPAATHELQWLIRRAFFRGLGDPIVDERFLRAAHRRGMPVHVWTVDDPNEMRRLLDLGVDGIMTDRPAELKSVLEERGSWS